MNEEEKNVEEVKEGVSEPQVEPIEPIVQEDTKTEDVTQTPIGNNKKGGNKVIIIIMGIIIVALLVALLILLLGGSKKENTEKNNENKNVENIENTKNTEIESNSSVEEPINNKQEDLTENEIKNIMDRFKAIKIESKRLYENDKFDISSINANEMMVTALSKFNIYNACSKSGQEYVLLSDINNELRKYIQKTLTIADIKSLNGASMGNPYDYDYGVRVEDNERIEVINRVCGGLFNENDYVYTKIDKGIKEGDYVYIYEKTAFARYNGVNDKQDYLVDYYKDYNKTGEVVEKLISKEFTDGYGKPKEGSTPNWNLYNTYKYTFKLINGEYYFQTLELVK